MTQPDGITPAEIAILAAPTPRDEIKQRQGPGGRMLDYVDARFVMDRLDEIGAENWQDQYVDRADGSVRGGIGVLISGEWIWKWDVGAQSDIEPEKGSYSEAFKRAGVKWGIARDLYNHRPSPAGTSSPANGAAAGRLPLRPAASTVPPALEEPEWFKEGPQPAQNGHSAATAGSDERMTTKEILSAAEAQGIPTKMLGDAARKLFGDWKLNNLDDEQRAVVWAEVAR